jgi:hypothetical protein
MNSKKNVDHLVEEAFNSINNIERAHVKPFLLSRVNSRMLSERKNSWWEKIAFYIGKPSFAIPGLAMLMLINLTTVVFYATEPSASIAEQNIQASSDEFSYSIASIYENENTEP